MDRNKAKPIHSLILVAFLTAGVILTAVGEILGLVIVLVIGAIFEIAFWVVVFMQDNRAVGGRSADNQD